MSEWDEDTPGRVENIFGSMKDIAPSQLCDPKLFNFTDLKIDRSGEAKAYEYEEAEVSSTNLGKVIEITFTNNPYAEPKSK